MAKRMIVMLLLVGLTLGGVFGFIAFKNRLIKRTMQAQSHPPQTVSTTRAVYQEWLPRLEAVGSVRAEQGADLSAEVAGIVSAIEFKQGDEVKAGALLVQLRAEDDIAKLESLKSAAELARITYLRDQAQFEAKAVSRQTLDTDAANLKQALANAAQQQALVNKKSIRAPFAGQLGIRRVDLGQYLSAGTAVVTLQSLDPVFVDFFLPQQTLAEIQVGQAVSVRTDAYPDEHFGGRIAVIDPKVDADTRNIQVRGVFKNPGHRLLPGMYASVSVAVGQPRRYLTLPLTAITFNPDGATVFRVEQNGKDKQGNPRLVARQNFVTLGETRGDQVAVIKGVSEGETVVTAGQIKLRNGSTVLINNTVEPTNDAAPQPPDE